MALALDAGGAEQRNMALVGHHEVDERGYVYIVDRHGAGLHILELTDAARRTLGLPSRATR